MSQTICAYQITHKTIILWLSAEREHEVRCCGYSSHSSSCHAPQEPPNSLADTPSSTRRGRQAPCARSPGSWAVSEPTRRPLAHRMSRPLLRPRPSRRAQVSPSERMTRGVHFRGERTARPSRVSSNSRSVAWPAGRKPPLHLDQLDPAVRRVTVTRSATLATTPSIEDVKPSGAGGRIRSAIHNGARAGGWRGRKPRSAGARPACSGPLEADDQRVGSSAHRSTPTAPCRSRRPDPRLSLDRVQVVAGSVSLEARSCYVQASISAGRGSMSTIPRSLLTGRGRRSRLRSSARPNVAAGPPLGLRHPISDCGRYPHSCECG